MNSLNRDGEKLLNKENMSDYTQYLKSKTKFDGEVEHDDRCPDCGEKYKPPVNPLSCTCPTMIYIPAGRHIHVDCPVHGKVVMRGNSVFC